VGIYLHGKYYIRDMKKYWMIFFAFVAVSCNKCKDEPEATLVDEGPMLVVKFVMDPNQERLNNLGQLSVLPAGHAAVSPDFNSLSAHYFELASTIYTPLGEGEVIYMGPESMAGGANAINFDQAKVVAPGEVFLRIPIKDITPGTYNYPRISLLYQNYDIPFTQSGMDLTGTVASFLGYNTYISNYKINTQTLTVNDDKLQGFWGFETTVFGTPYTTSGQAPEGATTVPNPLFATSPIPQGSCVVTGVFDQPLVISGNETQDIHLTISFSNNQSFEWVDINADGKWEPNAGENVVDMGIRGMLPMVEY
jgi:hypothetical protein